MAKVTQELRDAVSAGQLVGYSVGDTKITLLSYMYNDEKRMELPLLTNTTRQWRCWITESDNMIHRASGTLTGNQKELKILSPTHTFSGFEGSLAKAVELWVNYQKKGYSPHHE
jgi:hypothetical protein